MSRLTDLIIEAKKLDSSLGTALESEMRHLQERRAFGLNFERHTPEAVDLYGRPVRKGDKVRMLPARSGITPADNRVWVVTGRVTKDGSVQAELVDPKTAKTIIYPMSDLVVVAEQNDVIYPGLVSTGKVERGGDKPFHTVINAENLHALKALMYTHKGKVDCIYIDPPYNTGAKDWKYNNDYVEDDDLYRHSKWLAFMERRLAIAKELLNPEDSVLIITIDEKEYLRLGLLLKQTFSAADIQMVTSVIAPGGQPRGNQMSRVEEYVFVVYLGTARVGQDSRFSVGSTEGEDEPLVRKAVSWENLIRRGTSARRQDRENQFYPFLVDPDSGRIVEVGESLLPADKPRSSISVPLGLEIVWPIRSDESEGRWRISSEASKRLLKQGFVRVGRANKVTGQRAMNYVLRSDIARIEAGEIAVIGRSNDGSALLERQSAESQVAGTPKTVWNHESHNAGTYGTALVRKFLPRRSFPFPKSLYAVEDTLRLFINDKPNAVVLDFFAGSGTTTHAVMRLNRQDGGHRQCISVTNNEVSADEQTTLFNRGLRPGDSEWESMGICDHITKPRVKAAITGKNAHDVPIEGNYKFTDEFPISNGFEENAEFFSMTYQSLLQVATHRDFERVAPLLWLRAGARGRRIDSLPDGWDVANTYGVIDRLESLDVFVDDIADSPEVRLAFIVTDDSRRFQAACAALPTGVEPVRLYESYLRNFQIEAQRNAR